MPGKIAVICPICGTIFSCYPSRLDNAKYTPVCSPKCLYEGRSLGIIKREAKKKYVIVKSLRKRINKICPICNRIFETIPSKIENRRGKYCSRKCFEIAHKANMLGKHNPSWIDGRSYTKRSFRGTDWEEIRKKVYERDGYTCQLCSVKCISRRDMTDKTSYRLIQCHHIKDFESEVDNDLNNLITLCVSCHAGIHQNGGDVNCETPNNMWRGNSGIEEMV